MYFSFRQFFFSYDSTCLWYEIFSNLVKIGSSRRSMKGSGRYWNQFWKEINRVENNDYWFHTNSITSGNWLSCSAKTIENYIYIYSHLIYSQRIPLFIPLFQIHLHFRVIHLMNPLKGLSVITPLVSLFIQQSPPPPPHTHPFIHLSRELVHRPSPNPPLT